MPDSDKKETEHLANKKESAKLILEKVCKENELGELNSFYYAHLKRSGWWMIFDLVGLLAGDSGSSRDNARYYIGLTDSHLVMYFLTSNFLPHPAAKPIIAEFDQVRCEKQEEVEEGIKYVIKISGRKYKFTVPRKIDGWKDDEKDFGKFVGFFNKR